MSTVHITEAELLQNPAALLAHMRAGAAVVIENEEETIGKVYPEILAERIGDPEYDEWFRAEVQEALDGDPADDIDGEVVEAYFAERKRMGLLKLQAQKG